MKQFLKTGILDWVTPKNFDPGNYSNNSPIGSFLEVDLGYPHEFHNLRNDYPLVREKIKVRKQMLSECQLQIIEGNNFSFGKNKKRIPNLDTKRKYKLHYQKLNFSLKFRVTMKKNHRILEFKQEVLLKLYIEDNIDLRREAKKEGYKFKKITKLKSSTIFGELMENRMNTFDVKIVITRKSINAKCWI